MTKFQSRLGRHRSYDTQEEADAYDDGWYEFPRIQVKKEPSSAATRWALRRSAYWTGYFDREQEFTDRDEMRQEETRARYED